MPSVVATSPGSGPGVEPWPVRHVVVADRRPGGDTVTDIPYTQTWITVRDARTPDKVYGGGLAPIGVPRVGDHFLTGHRRGRDVTEERQWVRVTAVGWEAGRAEVTLYVVPEPLPVPYRVTGEPDGT